MFMCHVGITFYDFLRIYKRLLSDLNKDFTKRHFSKFNLLTDPKGDVVEALQNSMTELIQKRLPDIEIHPIDEPHMSFTRTVILRYHWIDEFVSSVKSSLDNLRWYVTYPREEKDTNVGTKGRVAAKLHFLLRRAFEEPSAKG